MRKDKAVTLLLIVLCLVGAAGCIKALAFIGNHPAGTDFDAYATGGRIVSTSPQKLYDLHEQFDAQTKLLGAKPSPALNAYVDPPLVAWMLSPIARLPLVYGVEAFLILSVICAVLAAGLVRKLLPETMNKTHRWFLPLAFAVGPGTVASLLLLQLELILVIFTLVALLLASRGRLFLAGIVLAALGAKAQYVWVIPIVLIMARQWRLLAGLATGGGIWIVTTFVFVGSSGISDFLRLLGKDPPLLSLVGLANSFGWSTPVGLAGAGIVLAIGLGLSWRFRKRLAKDPLICCILGIAISTAASPHISVPAPLLISLYLIWQARVSAKVPIFGFLVLYVCTSVFLYDASLPGEILFDIYLVGVAVLLPFKLRSAGTLIPATAPT